MDIKEILDEIASESSTNQKMIILEKHKENELLKKVLYKAKSPRIKFYIKQVPEHNIILTKEEDQYTLEQILVNIEAFSIK